jgi:hypothetical protein
LQAHYDASARLNLDSLTCGGSAACHQVNLSPDLRPFISSILVDAGGAPPPGAGDLFGIVAVPDKVYFVDDGTNTFNVLE